MVSMANIARVAPLIAVPDIATKPAPQRRRPPVDIAAALLSVTAHAWRCSLPARLERVAAPLKTFIVSRLLPLPHRVRRRHLIKRPYPHRPSANAIACVTDPVPFGESAEVWENEGGTVRR